VVDIGGFLCEIAVSTSPTIRRKTPAMNHPSFSPFPSFLLLS
jgi:hypothetical protein